MHRKLLAASMLASVLISTSHSFADDRAPTFDRVSFQVSASEEIANDILVAVMYQERDGQKPSTIADEVNRDITWAVELAKRAQGIKVQTLGYHQQPQYRNQSLVGWTVRQSILLESADTQALDRKSVV